MNSAPPLKLMTLLILFGWPGQLFGHGGQYQLPQPLGPMTGVRSEDAGRYGGGTTPSPGFPGANRSGPLARKHRVVVAEVDWQTWWHFNGPQVLSLLSDSHFHKDRQAVISDWEPIRALLQKALGDSESDLVDSAVIARSRSASSQSADDAFQDIWPFLAHPDQEIRRSAVFSMGLLESGRAAPVLLSMLHNTSRSDVITNATAAIALGYLSEPQAVAELERVVKSGQSVELRRAAVVSLGLFSSQRREIVLFLLEQLEPRALQDLPDLVSSAIPIALGRLGDAATPALPVLRRLAREQRTGLALRRGSVIALGRLAPADDLETMELLIRTAMTQSDPSCRGYALMAVGALAARHDPSLQLSGQAALRGRKFLVRTALGQRGQPDQPWACLAAALCLRTVGSEREEFATALLRIVNHTRDDSTRSAAVLALGILGAQAAIPTLREVLADRSAPNPAGYAALSLGLLGDRTVSGPLRQLLVRGDDPASHSIHSIHSTHSTRDRAATALALLSPEMASGVLERMLQDAVTLSETVWVAQTLGRVGCATAIPPLVRLAADEEAPTLSRAFALVGLGRLLEPGDLPWNARLATDCDCLSLGQAETALLDIY